LDNQRLKTIYGIVIPSEWDHDGSVLSVAIMSKEESSYRVENTALARELFKFLQQEVKVIGKVKELGAGKFEIQIFDYMLINPLVDQNT
jgi:hypothetical protein